MRTNIEDDIIASGRLGAFSRAAKILESDLPQTIKDELAALGALVLAYRDTQAKRFSTGHRDRLRSLLSVRFGPLADTVIDALVSSDLAVYKNDSVTIKGNRAHLSRIDSLRASSTQGGKMRAKNASRRKDGTFTPAVSPGVVQALPAKSSVPDPDPDPDPKEEQRAREVRSTRGFPEAAFEAEFRQRGSDAGVVIAAFDNLEHSIAGKLVLRCGKEGITQAQLLAEWWHPSWRVWHGFAVKQLEKHFALVRAAVADPKLRPHADRGSMTGKAPQPTRARPPSAEETERRLRAEDEALAKEAFISNEEAERRFAEMRRKANL